MIIEDINRGKIIRLEYSDNWGISVNLDDYNYNFKLDLDSNITDSDLNTAITNYLLNIDKYIPEVIREPEVIPDPVTRDTLVNKLVNEVIRK